MPDFFRKLARMIILLKRNFFKMPNRVIHYDFLESVFVYGHFLIQKDFYLQACIYLTHLLKSPWVMKSLLQQFCHTKQLNCYWRYHCLYHLMIHENIWCDILIFNASSSTVLPRFISVTNAIGKFIAEVRWSI